MEIGPSPPEAMSPIAPPPEVSQGVEQMGIGQQETLDTTPEQETASQLDAELSTMQVIPDYPLEQVYDAVFPNSAPTETQGTQTVEEAPVNLIAADLNVADNTELSTEMDQKNPTENPSSTTAEQLNSNGRQDRREYTEQERAQNKEHMARVQVARLAWEQRPENQNLKRSNPAEFSRLQKAYMKSLMRGESQPPTWAEMEARGLRLQIPEEYRSPETPDQQTTATKPETGQQAQANQQETAPTEYAPLATAKDMEPMRELQLQIAELKQQVEKRTIEVQNISNKLGEVSYILMQILNSIGMTMEMFEENGDAGKALAEALGNTAILGTLNAKRRAEVTETSQSAETATTTETRQVITDPRRLIAEIPSDQILELPQPESNATALLTAQQNNLRVLAN
ncbi:MAG: hypothetical protein ACOCXQ_02375 [Patescibacteria group bacterium]